MKRIYKVNMVLAILFSAVVFCYLTHIYSNRYNSEENIMNQEINAQMTLYTKPGCMFCIKAKNFLKDMKVNFKEIDVSTNRSKHKELISQTGSKTVPYIFINDTYIGGCTDMLKMAEEGILAKMLVM